jgi:serine/threonine-protein kinase
MDDLLARLTILLGDRYEVLREIGRGGMASVYLAQDRRHPRQVAIKVFRQDVAADVGHERFRREIAVAAALSHPNILALYDSGESGGLLYYVMPYVTGESVGQRVAREGQLPIGESLAIARQVAAALQYAHTAGVVHRDIKPDNIMLSGDLALVTDFGIAHAVEQTGDQKLTAAGYAVGTPAYMSPEQCTGGTRIDGRSDIYSLGCVLYTMLIGQPPFGGPTAQATLARHLAEPVPSLRVVRSTVPLAVEAAVLRALAKSPADRFQSAAEFATAISPEHLSDQISISTQLAPRRARRWIPAAVVAAAVIIAVALTRPWSLIRQSPSPVVDSWRVAVIPFDISGVADPALHNAATSVTALVVQGLPGDGGPRAVAVTTSGPPSDRDAIDLARHAGASQVIRGSVASLGGRLRLTATLEAVANDSILAHVDDVAGPPDSLVAAVDRLVARLLTASMSIEETDRTALSALPLTALRSYLGASRAFVLGRSEDAIRMYATVLQADSACYPAALGLAAIEHTPYQASALALAKAQLGRMNGSDSLFFQALELDQDEGAPAPEKLRLFDRAANLGRPSSVTWYLLGEHLFHDGPKLGAPDALRRAAASFDRALAIEPDLVPALAHRLDLAAANGDTSAVRALAQRYFALDSVGRLADFYRWRVAVALADQRALRSIRARISQFNAQSLERIVNVAQFDGVGLADARMAASILWQHSGASAQARWAFMKQRELALNTGRPAEATAILQRWRATDLPFSARDAFAEVVNALYWGADTTGPSRWVRETAPTALAQLRGNVAPDDSVYFQACGVSLWRVAHGDANGIPDAVQQLRKWRSLHPDLLCADIVDAQLAAITHAPDARRRLERLDSIAGSAPPSMTWSLVAANLTAARIWEAAGVPVRALAAVRRRPYITDIGEQRILVALSTMLREEGRLAALAGDTAGAITAYRRYLALRDDSEPAMAREVAGVRTELQRLEHRIRP